MAYAIHVSGPANILDATALVISQVEGQAANLGIAPMTLASSGEVFPRISSVIAQAPRLSLTTQQVAGVLGKITSKGLVLATGFEVYNQLVSLSTGLRTAGSVHQKLAIATGIVVPRRLSCSHGQVARLTLEVIGVNAAGSTNPVVITENSALPTVVAPVLHTLGPVKINGSEILGVQSVDVDFGIAVAVHAGSGAVFPQACFVTEIKPRITITVDDAAVLATLTAAGLAQTATDSVVYFRKMAANGTRVTDITAEHVSVTVDDGLWVPGDKSASHPGAAQTSLSIEPVYDGTNEPIALNTAVAIS
jgi:hypothetical protein